MRATFICQGCGALIGELCLTRSEGEQLGVDLLTAQGKEDIIKSATGDLFIYSLCDSCAENVGFKRNRSNDTVLLPPDS
ncbi:MAG: anti-sigma-F factor Fin family protein [Firmicutes bacterium]|nr:anti-sigma-F factor Fin family protein [Bacillota bacterium]